MAEKKTILIDLQFDTANINKGLTDVRRNIKGLNEEVGGLKKTFTDYGKEFDATTEKQKKRSGDAEKQAKKEEEALAKKIKQEEEASKKKAEQDALALQQAEALEQAINQVGDTIGESLGASPRAQELIGQLENTKKNIDLLTASNKTLKDGLKEVEVGSESYNRINKALQGNEAQLKTLKGEYSNLSKELQNNIKENEANEGSYEQLYRRWTQADIALKNLQGTMKINADGTVELTAEYKKAKAEVDNLKTGLIKFGEGIKDGRLNVGNYKNSIKEAWQEMGLFGQATSQLNQLVTQTSAGVTLAKEGVKLFADGIGTVSRTISSVSGISFFNPDEAEEEVEAVEKVTESITTATESLGEVTEQATEVKESIADVGKAGTESGKQISVGTNVGSNGMKVLKGAIVATGIGALVVIVGSLIQYFQKFQKGMDLVAKVTAVVGSVINSIVGTVVKLGTAIATLDFGAFVGAFKNAGNEAVESAKKTAQLEDAKVKLEEAEIRNKKAVDEYNDSSQRARLLSEDRTKSATERIKLIEQANQDEKKALELTLGIEAERLRILNEEIAKKQKSGSVTREELDKQADLEIKVGDIKDEIANKEIQTAKETSRLRNRLNAEAISNAKALAQAELTIAEAGGKKAFDLRRQIAKQERDEAIATAEETGASKEVIEKQYQAKIAVINAEITADRKARAKEIEQAESQAINNRLNLIVDGKTRELQLEAQSLKDALANIEKKGKAEADLRQSLIEASAKRVREIEIKYAEETYNEILAKDKEFTDQQIAQREQSANQRLTQLSQQQANEITALINAGATATEIENRKVEQQREFANQSLLIEQQRLAETLALQRASAGTQALQTQELFNKEKAILDQQLASKKISQEQYDTELAQKKKENDDLLLKVTTENSAQIISTEQALAQTQLDIQQTKNDQLIEDSKRTTEILKQQQEQQFSDALNIVNAFKSLFATDTKNRKEYKDVLKALSIAEIWINTYKEISNYWIGASMDTAKTLYGGVGATILASVLSAGALARGIANTSKVSKNEEGGYTLENAMKEYNPVYSANFKGGYVRTPTIWNLAGEKGTEYVAPNWQIQQNPALFSSLEQWRSTGVKPFADGGFTTTNITAPLMNSMEMLTSAISSGFASAPSPIVSVQEINTIQNRVTTIESRASL
jgi:hypothetical protein